MVKTDMFRLHFKSMRFFFQECFLPLYFQKNLSKYRIKFGKPITFFVLNYLLHSFVLIQKNQNPDSYRDKAYKTLRRQMKFSGANTLKLPRWGGRVIYSAALRSFPSLLTICFVFPCRVLMAEFPNFQQIYYNRKLLFQLKKKIRQIFSSYFFRQMNSKPTASTKFCSNCGVLFDFV